MLTTLLTAYVAWKVFWEVVAILFALYIIIKCIF